MKLYYQKSNIDELCNSRLRSWEKNQMCSVLCFLFWFLILLLCSQLFGRRQKIIKKVSIAMNIIDVNCTKINSDRYFCIITSTAVLNKLEILYWTPLIRTAEFRSPCIWMLLFFECIEHLGPILNIISIMSEFKVS